MTFKKITFLIAILSFAVLGCQGQTQPILIDNGDNMGQEIASETPETSDWELDESLDHGHADHEHYDDGLSLDEIIFPYGCARASSTQVQQVALGNTLADKFISSCLSATGSSKWCQQIRRPNPSSKSTFTCTYGSTLPHQLVHPNESTWTNAFKAIQIVVDLEKQGVSVAEIYNWWRPEPYNDNVGGAAGRHPFGTSVDVRFSSMTHMKKAHSLLCKMRKQGRLRALGYYGSTGLHLGIGDKTANTWGKSCP